MENIIDKISLIKRIPLFLECDIKQLEKISQICDIVEIEPGDAPISEGAALDFVYILLEGEIQVQLLVPPVGQIETTRLGPFDILGWSAMTPVVRHRTGTTTALTHCWLVRMDAKSLSYLCENDHEIGFIIYRRISNVVARSFLTTRLQLMNVISDSLQPLPK